MLKIFKENSIKIRKEFFKDPLIKSLWGRIYTSENQVPLITHIRRIRSSENGEEKFKRFVLDVKMLESEIGYEILGEESNSTEKIKIFTKEEALKDLRNIVANGKYNKKNT